MAAVALDAAKIRNPTVQTRPTAIIQIRGKTAFVKTQWVIKCCVCTGFGDVSFLKKCTINKNKVKTASSDAPMKGLRRTGS